MATATTVERDHERLREELGDAVVDVGRHRNAPAVVVRGDRAAEALRAAKAIGYDHCSCVTADELADRYETVYHLRSYDRPERELSVVVPTPRKAPESVSGAEAYPTAEWHEREAYDLLGIEYEGHPNLRRILLPETWQGHPLREFYDPERPQVVPYRENANPIAPDGRDGETMLLNVGPHHPATHGVLHLRVTLDGETVADVEPDIGYIHRCEEQMCQSSTYRDGIMPYPDRWDWGGAGILNEWAYARAAEDLLEIEVPEYAEVLRTLSGELCRICSHLLAVGTYALDVVGEFTAAFQYAVRDRELVQDLLEELTGQRLMFHYLRLGGVAWDLPDPPAAFLDRVRAFTESVPERLTEYRTLFTENELLRARTVDTGELPPELAKAHGCTGPVARGSGIDYDLRRDDPYGYYDDVDFEVVTDDGRDNYARLSVRLGEIRESARIVEQCADALESWPEGERTVRSNVPRTLKPDAGRRTYRAVEAAKGELGIYLRADGTETPGRFKIRGPSFSNLSALPAMATGEYVPDLIATLGSLDTIMGEVDR